MLAPPIPADEASRIRTLRSLGLLDTAAEERFDRLTRLARRLFDVPVALVSLVDVDRQWFKSTAGLDATQTSREVSFCGHAILSDELFLVPDAARDPRFADNPLVVGEPDIRFYAACPLKVGDGSRIGTLCLIDREPRDFGHDDRALLRDLARMAEQELGALQLATTDELTGLSNRRGFEALAQHALGVCRRLGRPASMAFVDLDGFKGINDRYGHAEGDRTLVEFARLLQSVYRESDVIGRLGGDEFAVLLTDCDAAGTHAGFQRLRVAVESGNARRERDRALRFSVGVVDFRRDRHATVRSMLDEADALMYRHKGVARGARTG
jgi:diguanylate cyclase (GGDEF)-like protein